MYRCNCRGQTCNFVIYNVTPKQQTAGSYFLSKCTARFIKLSVVTNIYNKETKGPTLMELFTATGILKKFSFDN
jgi:hypothetical protein